MEMTTAQAQLEMIGETLLSEDPNALAGALGLLATLIIGLLAVSLIRYLMAAIGYSKMFSKAGIAGWKAFIPFYNDYTKYKMVWKGMFYFLFLIASILVSSTGGSSGLLPIIITIASGIVVVVTAVKQHILMANAFGKGIGCALLLLFFPGITSLVLGFGKAQYISRIRHIDN